ncbi:MAG: choice-of-anchor J domain-containing protein, partial [Bacteroidales bacterium]
MKKIFYFLLAMIFAIQGWSQATLNEGFEGTVFPPDEWRIENTLGSSTPWTMSTSYAHSGTAHAYTNYNSSGSINYLITPKLSVNATNYQISFWARMDNFSTSYNQTFLKVLVSTSTNDVSSFDTAALLHISPSFSGTNQITATYQQWTIDLTTYIGQDIYVAFRQTDNDGYGLCLDDITGPELFVPTCPKPTQLIASNQTSTSIDLAWTDDGAPTSWIVEYKPQTSTTWTAEAATNNPYTISNLTSSTVYSVRAYAVCSANDTSSASVAINTATLCDVISSFPWSEGFESDWSPAVAPGNKPSPNCWTVIDRGGTNGTYQYWWKKGTTPAHSGGGHAVCYTDYGTSSHNDWLITPQIALTGNERLRFCAMRSSSTSGEPDEISIFISEENTVLDTTGMGTY